MVPPKPVFQDVGAASFMDALSIGSKIVGMASGFQGLGDPGKMFG